MYKISKDISKLIFREYDIRGVAYKDISTDVSYTIGKSFGSYISKLGKSECVIAHDNRLSSNDLCTALIQGIIDSGINVTYLGLATTPMFYFALKKLNVVSGIMLTASHNPKEDNGFKIIFDERGNARGRMISDFYDFTIKGEFSSGLGVLKTYDITDDYFSLFDSSLNLRNSKVKVVVDPGNGTTSIIAKKMYERYIDNVIMINDKSDGSFPFHHPDPSIESNLNMLKEKVLETKADIGISFDGDGDRVGFVDEKGNFLKMDYYMIIIIRSIIDKVENKTFLYDVKCSSSLEKEIIKLGGKPFQYRTGASYTKTKTESLDLPFGGELAGHIYFRDRFIGVDSGLYAGLRLVEIMDETKLSISELLSGVKKYESIVIDKIASNDVVKHTVIEEVKKYCIKKNYRFLEIDGIKVIFNDGWVLLRVSNTTPSINGRIEAVSMKKCKKLYNEFMSIIKKYNKW